MVNNSKDSKDTNEERLSMRNSIMVWVAGAVLGWVVAVVSVWTALNTPESNIAKNTPTDAEKMEQIMPAAGDQNKKDDDKED